MGAGSWQCLCLTGGVSRRSSNWVGPVVFPQLALEETKFEEPANAEDIIKWTDRCVCVVSSGMRNNGAEM
jgi:hypothetical protein